MLLDALIKFKVDESNKELINSNLEEVILSYVNSKDRVNELTTNFKDDIVEVKFKYQTDYNLTDCGVINPNDFVRDILAKFQENSITLINVSMPTLLDVFSQE